MIRAFAWDWSSSSSPQRAFLASRDLLVDFVEIIFSRGFGVLDPIRQDSFFDVLRNRTCEVF